MKFCSIPLPLLKLRFILLALDFSFLSIFCFAAPSRATDSLHPSNLTLYGDAYYTENFVGLTQNSSCAHFSPPPPSFGRALYSNPIRFLRPPNNSSASFSTRFTFQITGSPMCPLGDGLAFLITSDADSFSPSNGYMGLPAPSFQVEDSSYIAVEFDTSFDPTFGDVNGNHIGVDLGSVTSFVSTDAVAGGIDLKCGKPITAWVEYRSGLKLLRVWAALSKFRPRSPILVAQVDLSKHFKEFMYVGFSSSNGQGSANHMITNWRFGTFGFASLGVPVNNLEGGDCLMCFPEKPNVPIKGSHMQHKHSRVRDLALGLGGLVAFIIALILIIGSASFYLIKRSRKSQSTNNDRGTGSCVVDLNRVPTNLSLAEITRATLDFNQNRIIGEGASATVYQGTLPRGGPVAVKRFNRESRMENYPTQFVNEFATMAGCLRHKNLVQLQGWCCEGSELLLIYEYLPNGSLDKFLYGSSSGILTWELRKKIVLGVASALTYLHEECERQIIHRDVKACNIMLDAEFNAKLGDFGLAEVYEHSSITRAVTIPAGTMGYLAPEYVYFGVPTVKTDVYSFGVVVLEVATGRRPVEEGVGGSILVDWVWDLWEKGRILTALDSKLRGKCDEAEAIRMLKVGLCCVNPEHYKRPTMKEAARILKGEVPVPPLPPKKPSVRIGSVLLEKSEEILNLGLGDGSESSQGRDDQSYMTPMSQFSSSFCI